MREYVAPCCVHTPYDYLDFNLKCQGQKLAEKLAEQMAPCCSHTVGHYFSFYLRPLAKKLTEKMHFS